ncbi:MAG: glycosyltransferase family 4 protein [Candidatus Altiarchaeota archaeon]
MNCLVAGYFGERSRPHGGTQYVRNLLENPPSDVNYSIPRAKLEWHNLDIFGFLKNQKVSNASEVQYYRRLEAVNRLLRWRTKEFRAFRGVEDDVDLVFYNQGLISTKKPYVSCVEGDYILTNNPEHSPLKDIDMRSPLARAYQRIVLKHFLLNKNLRKILFWSDKARTESLKLFPEIKEKSCILYPPVCMPKKKLRRDGDTVRLLFIGGDWARKGLLVLTEAFARLSKRFDVTLSVVTEDSFRSVESEPGISVYSNLAHDQVFPRMYLDHDVFVLPSRFETFGYSILEAMACALPVISTDVYAIPELVEDGVSGYLTPYGDSHSLAEKLSELVEDASLRRKMGDAGRRQADEKSSVPVFTKKLDRIYGESLNP